MSKVRVSALAKELKISSDALVQILRSIDVPAKTHSSNVDASVKEAVQKKLNEERAAIKEKYAKNKERVRRRRPGATAETPEATENTEANESQSGGDERRPTRTRRTGRGQDGEGRGGYNRNRGPRQDGDTRGGDDNRGGYNRDTRGGYNRDNRDGDNRGGYNRGPRQDGDNRGGYNRGPRQDGDNRGGYNRGPRQDGDNRGGYNRGPRQDGDNRGGYNRGPRQDGDNRGGDNRGGYNRGPRQDGDNRGGYNRGPRQDGDNRGGYNRGPRQDGDNRGGYNRGPRQDGDNRGGYNRGPRQDGDNRGGDNRGGYNRGPRQDGDNRGGDNRGGYNRGPRQDGDNRGGFNRGPRPDGDSRGGFNKSADATGGASSGFVQKEDHRKKTKKKKKKEDHKKGPDKKTSELELKANIKKTMAKIGSSDTKKKYKKKINEDVEVAEDNILHVSEFISVSEFAEMIKSDVSQVIAKCLELGLFVTINQRLDFETIQLLAEEWGYTAQLMDEFAEEDEEDQVEENYPEEPRAPVVTIMGHVDHGKTSLLDYIRSSNVTDGESGGITQHIAAYEVETKNGKVTFLDTPGHEAFSAMRARGSQVTDVAVIIVAADSAVMPQTKEAIDHAKAAEVPIVIAINKIDLPTANPDKIKAELAGYNVLVEDYGGQVSCVEISSKTGQGVNDLLELLALETELLELKAPKEGKARGVVIESELDKGRGAVATVLMQRGTLRKGDPFVTGIYSGRVREMLNDHGKKIDKAEPAQPVMVLGLSGTPQAGDSFRVADSDKDARELSSKRRLAEKEREMRMVNTVSLDNFYDTIKAGEVQTLNVIVKGDVDGSVQAVAASLEELSTEEVKVKVILKGVGGVTEADIMLAQASQAIIIGFHISPNPKIKEHAKAANVEIRTYRIIYEAVDEVRDAMIGMLAPEIKEEITGNVEIREVFKVSKIGHIAGCYVTDGKVERNSKVRLIRDDIVISETTVDSLQRGKDRAKDVAAGHECGIILDKITQYQVGDRIEVYTETEIARKEL